MRGTQQESLNHSTPDNSQDASVPDPKLQHGKRLYLEQIYATHLYVQLSGEISARRAVITHDTFWASVSGSSSFMTCAGSEAVKR